MRDYGSQREEQATALPLVPTPPQEVGLMRPLSSPFLEGNLGGACATSVWYENEQEKEREK